MERRRAQLALSASLVSLLLSAGVAAAAPSGGPRCNPRKTACTTTVSTTTTTAVPTTTTSTSTTTTTTAPPADTTPPTAAIASPTQGATVTGGVTVSGSSSDNRSVARVDVSVDGGTWIAASGTSSWSRGVDTTGWAAGSTHSVAARAIDGAGNVSSTATVSLQEAAAPTSGGGTGDPSIAPATQGSWVSPEGVTVDVNTAGAWTIRDIYRMLLENSSAPGDFAQIAPTLTVKVQDQYSSWTAATGQRSGGAYTKYSATLYLKGVSSTFASVPDSQLAHEYGHVWTLYHLMMSRNGDWSSYLGARWTSADGSVRLANDSRLDSGYEWDKAEIIAEDYRLLFGSPAAQSQRPLHLNSYIPQPNDVAGLREFFLATWAG
jgi:Bacterial Ig domain